MIDWLDLFKNSLWILSLSLGLAVLGLSRWEAQISQHKLRQILAQPSKLILLDLVGLLFCAGMASTSTRWWEIALWMIMLVFVILQTGVEIRRRIINRQTRMNGKKADQ